MPVIKDGIIVQDNSAAGTKPRTLYGNGAPVAGTTYDGTIQVGQFYVDVDTGNLYEYTEPAAVPTFTRIDTV